MTLPEPQVNQSRKDYLLERINDLKSGVAVNDANIAALEPQTKHLEVIKEQLRKAYEEVQRQYHEAQSNFHAATADLRDKQRIRDMQNSEMESLKRELSRLLDTEQINAAYLAQVEAFKERCLDAIWRPENRDDGRGAMPHQIDGAISLAVAGQALLGDKRGLGKTLTSLIYCDFVEAKKVIAIVPSDTMDNFIREVELWAPHRSPLKIGGMPKKQRDFVLPAMKQAPEFMMVVNYEAWRRDWQLVEDLVNLGADTLLLDEAHRAKEWDTHTCRGVRSIRFGINTCPLCGDPDVTISDKHKREYRVPLKLTCDNCGIRTDVLEFCSIKNVLPMTGTPILNKPQELFPQLHLIDPVNFQSVTNFLDDFCWKGYDNHWTWRHGAESNLMKIIGPRYLARTRESAGVIIPPAQLIDHIITMDEIKQDYPKQYGAYEQARDYAQIVLDPDNQIAMSMPAYITVLLRLRQVITWPAAIELKWTDPNTEEERVTKLDVHESAKLDKAEELIREINEEGERVVVFSQFRGTLDELQRRLGERTATYHGGTSKDLRNLIQLDFDPKTVSDTPRWDNVLCNYKAAGEGLNLNAATQMVILDEPWNPGTQEQAYGRIDRLGQTRDTTIHTIRVEGSVDSWMHALIQAKKEMVGGFEAQGKLFRDAYDALRKGLM